jgi:hypothetical protein
MGWVTLKDDLGAINYPGGNGDAAAHPALATAGGLNLGEKCWVRRVRCPKDRGIS